MLQDIHYLLLGGPVMYPLFVCAIAAVYVMVERFVALSRLPRAETDLVRTVGDAIKQGRFEAAEAAAAERPGPVAEVLARGLSGAAEGRDEMERRLEAAVLDATPHLSRRLGVLDTVITVAPLLGLLGTVTGMIRSFHVVASASGLGAPTAITSGVAEALIATATGLAIAIVTLVGYNYLGSIVREISEEMQIAAANVLTQYPSEDDKAVSSSGPVAQTVLEK